MKYIDAERLREEVTKERKSIEGLFVEGDNSFYDGQDDASNYVLALIDSLQQEQESIAEQFAKIVRANLSEIGKDTQSQFEQLHSEITGNKMYGGYND